MLTTGSPGKSPHLMFLHSFTLFPSIIWQPGLTAAGFATEKWLAMLPLPDPEPQHLSPCLCRALDMDTVLPRCLYIPRALKVASDFLLGLEVFEGHHLISSGTSGKESPINARDTRDAASIPESGRSPGGGNGSQLQYPCLENSMDRGAWQATAHGVAKSWIGLSN